MESYVKTLSEIIDETRLTEITFIAASVAFYAFFSVVPLVILALATASAVGGASFENRVVEFVGVYLSSEGEAVVSEALTNPSGRIGASVAGFVALSWSALKVFRAVGVAFDRIYGTDGDATFLGGLLDAAVVLVAVVFGVGIVAVFGALASDLKGIFGTLAGWTGTVAGTVAVLLPLYYFVPSRSVTVRGALPGTATACAGWLVLGDAFSLYASLAARYQAYGFLGAVLLFLLWLYLGASVVLFGAVVNEVVAR